nr:PREDICTED: uncharacterized protein LOC109034699 [Bemisia tabaci]
MPMPQTAAGFVQACPGNLPGLDTAMLIEFFQNPMFQEPELRHVKTMRSTRVSYGDNAVGYVQVKREGGTCHVMAKITPEHRINSPPYQVHVVIDEKEEKVKEAYCAGSADCCKHAVAFVAWLHREAEKKSVTDVQSYWHKSKLSSIKTSTPEDMRLEKMVKQKVAAVVDNDAANTQEEAFYKELTKELCKNKSCSSLLKQHLSVKFSYAIHHLLMKFIGSGCNVNADDFVLFCGSIMKEDECKKLARLTANQADDSLWFDFRVGRVTGSKAHEASRCKTDDGVTVNSVLGVQKFRETEAMKRGKDLEPLVRKAFQNHIKTPISCSGFVMSGKHPVFGASPDGLTRTHIVEIKCPVKMETFNKYFKDVNSSEPEPAPIRVAQMDWQMKMCGKRKGYFVVAYPNFKETGLFKVAEVTLDSDRIQNTMNDALDFWKKFIFPKLVDSILGVRVS